MPPRPALPGRSIGFGELLFGFRIVVHGGMDPSTVPDDLPDVPSQKLRMVIASRVSGIGWKMKYGPSRSSARVEVLLHREAEDEADEKCGPRVVQDLSSRNRGSRRPSPRRCLKIARSPAKAPVAMTAISTGTITEALIEVARLSGLTRNMPTMGADQVSEDDREDHHEDDVHVLVHHHGGRSRDRG